MSDISQKEVDELKSDVISKIRVLKENAKTEEDLEKIDKFIDFLNKKDAKYDDDSKKVKGLKKVNRGLTYFEKFKMSFEGDIDIDPGRISGLTDGIFGMVMTLLVFGIAVPEITMTSYGDFISFITALAPTIGVTIVSFILISSFWVHHHEFIKIKNLNITYLWINILFLISISFIPFTTSLIGNYSHFFLSEVLFGLNILLVNITFLLLYMYANKRNFLENKPSKHERKYVRNTLLMIMILTVVVNLLDFNVSSNFIYLFLLVPIISVIRDTAYKIKS